MDNTNNRSLPLLKMWDTPIEGNCPLVKLLHGGQKVVSVLDNITPVVPIKIHCPSGDLHGRIPTHTTTCVQFHDGHWCCKWYLPTLQTYGYCKTCSSPVDDQRVGFEYRKACSRPVPVHIVCYNACMRHVQVWRVCFDYHKACKSPVEIRRVGSDCTKLVASL